ncbi:MAG TPA: F0F1 ATP synthase subunit epsilon [Anaerolineae bacterium]|nr:F0F1 ATP synthase subunit epsilon [Anaerolineae bacterium]
MAQIRCEVVTAERTVFDDSVDMVVAPGIQGQLGILPHHAPLMTSLTYGELIIHREGYEDEYIAIGGGFMEVGPDHVTILADSAERAEEIDLERAEVARQRAEELMAQKQREDADLIRAEAALRRSMLRLKVARRKRRAGGRVPGTGQPPGAAQ